MKASMLMTRSTATARLSGSLATSMWEATSKMRGRGTV